jgi:hypothetical protein
MFWVCFCILYDIDNKLGLLKKHGFLHFPTNKMFVVLVGWDQVKQDLFVGCFNIRQERKEKVAIKGLTLNANMDKCVERKNCCC